MAIRYVFREVVVLHNGKKADPQRIGEALAKIQSENDGRLDAGKVVEAAADRKHVLHRHFEWNDAKAAEAYRVDQARTIIRAIRVEEDGDEARPAFISINDHGRSYRAVGEVATSRQLQLSVLVQAERDLKAFENRYRMLQDVCVLIADARERVAARRAELGGEATAA